MLPLFLAFDFLLTNLLFLVEAVEAEGVISNSIVAFPLAFVKHVPHFDLHRVSEEVVLADQLLLAGECELALFDLDLFDPVVLG